MSTPPPERHVSQGWEASQQTVGVGTKHWKAKSFPRQADSIFPSPVQVSDQRSWPSSFLTLGFYGAPTTQRPRHHADLLLTSPSTTGPALSDRAHVTPFLPWAQDWVMVRLVSFSP